jgi:ABC-2 type transport system permease protein
MNLLKWELKAYRKSLMIWCIGVILLITSGMSKYKGMVDSGQSMNELMEEMPKSLQSLMGTGVFDLSKASGYYGVLFLYLLVMAAIHAGLLGASIISKEERDKTSEFLFIKPMSRRKIINYKLIAGLFNIVIFNVTTLVSSLFVVNYFSNGVESVNRNIMMLMIGMLLLQLLFLVLGTTLASGLKKSKNSTALTTAVLLFTLILSIVIDLNNRLESLSFLTPFKYFEAKSILYGDGFDPVYVAISLLLIIISTVLTFVFFEKRDLHL